MNSQDLQYKNDKLYKLRHSMAHVLAYAVKQLFPEAMLGFGPPVDNGFYYDFDFAATDFNKNSDANLKKIKKQMKKILSKPQGFSFEKFVCDYDNAIKLCKEHNELLKLQNVELLKKRNVSEFSFYKCGDFIDLCQGPHVLNSCELSADCFDMDRISGAYWLGSEKNKMLTRIYVHCFLNKQDLINYKAKLALAKKNDHHKLGAELELFKIDAKVGKGLIFWLPAGETIKSEIEKYAKELEFKYNYQRISTPIISKKELYQQSGHLSLYSHSMFPPMTADSKLNEKNQQSEHEQYYLRPMNCPHHHLVYNYKPRSYKDLPVRLAEFGDTYRYEKSGELSGLLRVRSMCINDGHIYCTQDQVQKEINDLLDMFFEFYKTFKLSDYSFRLSLRDKITNTNTNTNTKTNSDSDLDVKTESQAHINKNKKDIDYDNVTDDNNSKIDDQSSDHKYDGSDEIWNKSEKILKDVLEKRKINYQIGYGEAAFYGPKIDVQFKNLFGREETVSTIQLDFLAAQKFDLFYTDASDEKKHPIVIHRAPLSTNERFISFLIEYYGGAFPTWCAATQVAIIPVHEGCIDYAKNIYNYLFEKFIRVKLCDSNDSFSKKIRLNMKSKIPINLIIGNKEQEQSQVSIRGYGSSETISMSLTSFYEKLDFEIKNRVFYDKKD